MSGRSASVFALFLFGCGYPTYHYADEATVQDGSTEEQPDVEPPRDGCIPNGCGGCNDQGIKGQRCEPCGQWTCAGTSVVCTAAMPAPGAACGICGTQLRTCTSAGTTTCPMDDDRLVYDDAKFETRSEKEWVVDRTNEALIAFKSVRTISYYEANVVLRAIPYVCADTATLPHPDPACTACAPKSGGGYSCAPSTPKTIGDVTVTLYSGSPTTGLAPLATSSVSASTIPTTSGWIAFTLSAPVSPRPVGTPLAIGITTESTAFAFEVYGGGASSFPAAAPDTVFWHRSTKPTGAWIEEPSTDLAHVLRGKACAP